MFLKAISFLVVTMTLLSGCGKKAGIKEGYYVAQIDLRTAHYPLVVVRHRKGQFFTYQLSHVGGSFSAGMSSTDEQTAVGETACYSRVSNGFRSYDYVGEFVQEGTGLRMRSLSVNPDKRDRDSKDRLIPHKVEQEYLMDVVDKSRALEVLRTLVTVQGAGLRFSNDQEENCQGAFDMSCNEIFTNSAPAQP